MLRAGANGREAVVRLLRDKDSRRLGPHSPSLDPSLGLFSSLATTSAGRAPVHASAWYATEGLFRCRLEKKFPYHIRYYISVEHVNHQGLAWASPAC
jgi:hypothetical protein